MLKKLLLETAVAMVLATASYAKIPSVSQSDLDGGTWFVPEGNDVSWTSFWSASSNMDGSECYWMSAR